MFMILPSAICVAVAFVLTTVFAFLQMNFGNTEKIYYFKIANKTVRAICIAIAVAVPILLSFAVFMQLRTECWDEEQMITMFIFGSFLYDMVALLWCALVCGIIEDVRKRRMAKR